MGELRSARVVDRCRRYDTSMYGVTKLPQTPLFLFLLLTFSQQNLFRNMATEVVLNHTTSINWKLRSSVAY